MPQIRDLTFGDENYEVPFRLEDHPIKVGAYLTITETEGSGLAVKMVCDHE